MKRLLSPYLMVKLIKWYVNTIHAIKWNESIDETGKIIEIVWNA